MRWPTLPSTLPWQHKAGQSEIRQTFTLVTHVDIDTAKLRTADAHWESEVFAQKSVFDKLVESTAWESIVTGTVTLDLCLTVLTFIASEDIAESDIIFYASCILLSVLILDVLLRGIKEGRGFFLKWLNWLEVFVCLASAVMLVLDGIGRSCTGPDCGDNKSGKGASLGRAVRPLMRIFRVARAMMHMYSNRGGLHAKLDRLFDEMTDRIIRACLGDLLLVPGENITMKFSEGQFHLEKAQVKAQVFSGLHLPFTVLGGLIDFLHLDIDVVKSKTKVKDTSAHTSHRLLVIVENVLLVVGPGHHQEDPEPAWDFNSVLQTKKKLLDLINSRLEQTQFLWNKKKGEPKDTAEAEKKKIVAKMKTGGPGKSVQWMKEKMTKVLDEVLAHGMHASILNLEVRYEDPRGELSGGPVVVAGMAIGSVQIRAQGIGDGPLHTEEDFRVKGKWRRGTASGCYTHKEDEKALMKQMETVASALPDKKKKDKPSARKGIRAAATINRVSAFFDLRDSSTSPEAAGSYAAMLQDGKNVDVLKFLKDCRKARAIERLRMAILNEVEKRLLVGLGQAQMKRVERLSDVREPEKYKERLSMKLQQHAASARAAADKEKLVFLAKYEDKGYREMYCELAVAERSTQRITQAEGRSAMERMRRLRERVASHRYLLMPTGCSIHGILRTPQLDKLAASAAASDRGSTVSVSERSQEPGSWEATSSVLSMAPLATQATEEFWPPQTDIDVHIPAFSLAVDLSQARSIVRLIDYMKRWKIEEHRMMWYPPPHHSGYYAAFARWGYALRMVLHGINERYPWKSLAWVEMRRRSRMKFEYVDALCAPMPIDQDLVDVLQVGMPLPECVTGRYASLKFRSNEKERKKKETISGPALVVQKLKKSFSNDSFGSDERDGVLNADGEWVPETADSRKQMIRESYAEALDMEKEVESDMHIPAASSSALQFQLYLGLAQNRLLCPSPCMDNKPRRLLLSLEASGVQVVGSHSAPQVIWMKLAPPAAAAIAANSGDTPQGVAAEVGLEDVRAVFCGMPSSASKMRRLFGAPRLSRRCSDGASIDVITLRNIADVGASLEARSYQFSSPAASSQRLGSMASSSSLALGPTSSIDLDIINSGNSLARSPAINRRLSQKEGMQYQACAPPALSDAERINAEFFMQIRVAFVKKEPAEVPEENSIEGSKPVQRMIPRWELSVWTYPMEANLCHPLMKKLLANFKPPPWVPRWMNNSYESKRFWQELKMLASAHVAEHAKRAKKMKKAELLTGIAGPLVGSRICGDVLLRGGMRGTKLDVYSTGGRGSWLRATGAVPTGVIKVERVVDGGPQLKVAFTPASSSTRNVQFQSADGWWFASEEEAEVASTIFTTGQPSSRSQPNENDGWAGSVAHEDPDVVQDNIFELPPNVLSNWGSHARDGSLRSRYKPPVSAKGILPCAVPPRPRNGTPLGMALDCCRSLERNLPDPMKPALGMLAATMPKDGLSTCVASSPCPQADGRTQRPDAQTTPLMTPELVKNGYKNGYPAPSFISPEQVRHQLNFDTPAATAALTAERKISAEEQTRSDSDVSVEVVSAISVGLPEPTGPSLNLWWRTMGVIPE